MTPPVWRGWDSTSRVSKYQGMTPLVRRGLVSIPPGKRYQLVTPLVGRARTCLLRSEVPNATPSSEVSGHVVSGGESLGLAPSSQEVPGHPTPDLVVALARTTNPYAL